MKDAETCRVRHVKRGTEYEVVGQAIVAPISMHFLNAFGINFEPAVVMDHFSIQRCVPLQVGAVFRLYSNQYQVRRALAGAAIGKHDDFCASR
jgi:hypothetical protein